jgi:hypothetical protein
MASWTIATEPQPRPWWTRLRALLEASGLRRL